YNQINNDPTTPMYDRPFKEMRPPGSVFKMITATAALEKGSITPTSTIYDDVIFKDAGLPYLKNWSPISNGNINVTRALEVSCNYFFCDSAYLLGNAKNDGTLTAIGDLNEYMKYYGLNNDTGVEIGEAETPPDGVDRISGPLLKAYTVSQRSPNAASSDLAWHDGDTVQTAIGQSYNNYTAASMCKYIMTIATKGIRYQLHLVDSVVSHDRTQTTKTQPVIEESPSDLPIADSTWDAIYQGMYDVIHGTSGTGYNTFKGLDIEVAGKTGTAQQITGRNDHSSFGGFAPYDDPQIAVYVMIPFGDTKANPAVSSQIARDMIAYYFGVDAGAVDIKDSDTLVP
ncbi:MAG: penicillin-binding transpeptidase domain-containing protein, partial [Defluviitaleaceae bacterium]|nr:penicillin-binding transpeptidase domain-containing protein [Defluviitaleaceae bacterium]